MSISALRGWPIRRSKCGQKWYRVCDAENLSSLPSTALYRRPAASRRNYVDIANIAGMQPRPSSAEAPQRRNEAACMRRVINALSRLLDAETQNGAAERGVDMRRIACNLLS